jgi:hypothetical protein
MITQTQEPHWSSVYFQEGGYEKMSQAQKDAMYEEVYKPIVDGQKEIARSNKRLLRAIKKVKGETFYRNLKKCLRDLTDCCDHVDDMKYEIVRKPTGTFQKEPYGKEILGKWVDQWSTGTEGDSWAGYEYILIRTGRWLKVNYSM